MCGKVFTVRSPCLHPCQTDSSVDRVLLGFGGESMSGLANQANHDYFSRLQPTEQRLGRSRLGEEWKSGARASSRLLGQHEDLKGSK